MSSVPVRFAWALNSEGQEIFISDAIPGIHGYTCIGCQAPVKVCKGTRRQHHFKHQPRTYAPDKHCHYSDETYRHRLAKEILLEQQWVKVPEVLPRCPDNYENKLIPLRSSQIVTAGKVYLERSLFEDENGRLNYYRRQQLFLEEPGKRDLILRPDVMFTDATGKPVLLIEIKVSHGVNDLKLAKLMRLQIDTIEITIPEHIHPNEIRGLFNSVQHTEWLYNHERETAPPVGFNPGSATSPGGNLVGLPFDIGESNSIECQKFAIREALRGLKKCLGRDDVAAANRRLSEAEASLKEEETALDAEEEAFVGGQAGVERAYLEQLAIATRRLELDALEAQAALDLRTAEMEETICAEFSQEAAGIAKGEAEIQAKQSRLSQLYSYITERASRPFELTAVPSEQSVTPQPTQVRTSRIRELDEATAELNREEKELRRAEAAVGFVYSAKNKSATGYTGDIQQFRDAYERTIQAIEAETAAITAGLARFNLDRQKLRDVQDQAISRRSVRSA